MHTDKKKITRLLKTVRGQIDGLIKMIDENRDCIEISNQLLASGSILKKINLEVLKGHFTHCIYDTINSGDEHEIQSNFNEINTILGKMIK